MSESVALPVAVRRGAMALHDLVVVGTGPVGATLALALAGAGLDVVALDARASGETLRGDRSLALSHGTRLILERVGVWSTLASAKHAVTPIRAVEISQAHGFGLTRLDAADLGLPALGYVVSYVALQSAIDDALARAGVDVRYGIEVTSVGATPAQALVEAASGPAFAARLAVVADGTGAAVRGIARERHDYGQVALIAKVETVPPHDNVAYERFSSQGPLALLPEAQRYGLVWTMRPERAREVLAFDDRRFLDELAHRFGGRVAGFTRVEQRRTFPLVLEFARPTTGTRCAVIGNAAQTLHPVAGQGFNVGMRDAWELAQAIRGSSRQALGSGTMLARYAAQRRPDRLGGIGFTHGLVQLFRSDNALMRWPRGFGLVALDMLPPVKRAFTRAMLFGLRVG